VCVCGLWVVQYVMGSGRALIFPDRFVRGEFGEFSILGVGGRWPEACGIPWTAFCMFVVAKTRRGIYAIELNVDVFSSEWEV
jgi:hypothetical protein